MILRTSGQLVAGSTATTLALSSNPSLRSSSPARNTRPEPQDRPASTQVLPGFPTVRGWWGGHSTGRLARRAHDSDQHYRQLSPLPSLLLPVRHPRAGAGQGIQAGQVSLRNFPLAAGGLGSGEPGDGGVQAETGRHSEDPRPVRIHLHPVLRVSDHVCGDESLQQTTSIQQLTGLLTR